MSLQKLLIVFAIKIDINNLSRSREFRWENNSKWLKTCPFSLFSQKKKKKPQQSLEEKRETLFNYLLKNINIYQFNVKTFNLILIKNDFINMSEKR